MPRPCTICSHLDRDQIDLSLVGGNALNAIAERHQITRDSLARHKTNHLSPAVVRLAQQRANDASAVPVAQRLEEVINRANRLLDQAERKGALVASAQLLGQLRMTLETVAKISGELNERAQVNVLNIAASPDWLSLRSLILTALSSFPDARTAVVEALTTSQLTLGTSDE